MTLDKLKMGESAVIKAVGGEGALRLRFLDMGLIPKTKVKMLKRAPMGDPLDIVLRRLRADAQDRGRKKHRDRKNRGE